MAVGTLDTGALKNAESRILSDIPETWTKTTLGECFKWGSGGTPKSGNSEYYGGSIPWLVIGDLNDGVINKSDQTITEQGLENSSAKLVDEGTLLLAMYGSIGKLGIAGMKLATNQAIAFAEKNEIETKYIFSFLRYIRPQLSKLGKGATQQNISQTVIKAFPFPLAPLNEQKRIVAKIEELFSELDNGIAVLKTAREQLKVYRQAVLKHAFEGKLTAQWREENADKLESPEQLLERIQQEREARYLQQLKEWKAAVKEWEDTGKEGKKPGKPKEPPQLDLLKSALPFGWLTVSLNWLLTTEKKPMTTGPFGTALKKSEHQSDGIPVLGIENIGNGKFIPGNKIFVTEKKAEELTSFKVHPGEIVISRSGTVGEICEVPDKVNNALISTNLLRVSLDNNVILSPFFVLMFQGGEVKLQVKDLCKGSSREFLNQSILSSIKYPVCGLEEQRALLEQLDTIFSNIEQQDKEITVSLEKSETLRQSILKKAFSGQLVPQDPSDEPASELLARIQAEKAAEKDAQKVSAKSKTGAKPGAKRGRRPKVAS
ncbi:restriction endonuclease subunit S [Shewanella indica]|uniref:restriction endonuclease subunit S n=1 Tax=Shewanella indica TaxID=768528 RepID=UPI0030069C74